MDVHCPKNKSMSLHDDPRSKSCITSTTAIFKAVHILSI